MTCPDLSLTCPGQVSPDLSTCPPPYRGVGTGQVRQVLGGGSESRDRCAAAILVGAPGSKCLFSGPDSRRVRSGPPSISEPSFVDSALRNRAPNPSSALTITRRFAAFRPVPNRPRLACNAPFAAQTRQSPAGSSSATTRLRPAGPFSRRSPKSRERGFRPDRPPVVEPRAQARLSRPARRGARPLPSTRPRAPQGPSRGSPMTDPIPIPEPCTCCERLPALAPTMPSLREHLIRVGAIVPVDAIPAAPSDEAPHVHGRIEREVTGARRAVGCT